MRRKKAFTLVELLVVIAIIVLLIAILLPSLSRARELSKRLVCAANIKGVGTSAKIYANDNYEKWMVPGFKASAINDTGIEYEVMVGQDGRQYQSEKDQPGNSSAGSTRVSVTRSFWMLVRSGDVTVSQFICPSSGDSDDPTESVDFYYDFTTIDNISYAYQVPFGPRDTQPREGMDNRQVVAGDRSPFYSDPGNLDWEDAAGDPLDLDSSPKEWRSYNSRNHGGAGNGEGQNLLFADGHAAFHKVPIVGVDHDNVYTIIEFAWLGGDQSNLLHGLTPWEAPDPHPYPGQGSLGTNDNDYSSTDAFIYP